MALTINQTDLVQIGSSTGHPVVDAASHLGPIDLARIFENDVVENLEGFRVLGALEMEGEKQPVPGLSRLARELDSLLDRSNRVIGPLGLVVGHGQRVVGTRGGRFDLRDPGLERDDRVIVALEHRLKLAHEVERAELLDRRKRLLGDAGFQIFQGLLGRVTKLTA